jgi:hypothetical protein
MSRVSMAIPAVIALVALSPARPLAQVVDGQLDAVYGAPLVVQTTQTTTADNTQGLPDYSTGSELDAAYATISGGSLHLFLAGNQLFYWNLEGVTISLPIDVFIDCRPGGQNTLLANNPAFDQQFDLAQLAGLTFEPGFGADYWFGTGAGIGSWPRFWALTADLPAGGAGSIARLGEAIAGSGAPLAGGANPFGVAAALDLRNVAGVTSGCGAASGAGVTTGIEWSIPLAALGNPTGCMAITVFAANGNHSGLFNQVLGPLPPGTCSLGAPSGVNFAAIPGLQLFTVCDGPVPARHTTWGSLKTLYR